MVFWVDEVERFTIGADVFNARRRYTSKEDAYAGHEEIVKEVLQKTQMRDPRVLVPGQKPW